MKIRNTIFCQDESLLIIPYIHTCIHVCIKMGEKFLTNEIACFPKVISDESITNWGCLLYWVCNNDYICNYFCSIWVTAVSCKSRIRYFDIDFRLSIFVIDAFVCPRLQIQSLNYMRIEQQIWNSTAGVISSIFWDALLFWHWATTQISMYNSVLALCCVFWLN